MLTPQDIQDKEFSKAVFGGYDMAAVDDFLEELGNDYAALYKDNAVLKGKIKVLVDKVEEYRSTEDSMRLALSSAQKMADDMMAETQAKCDALIADAEKTAAAKRANAERDITAESVKLNAAKRETEVFIDSAKKLIAKFGEALDKAGSEFDLEQIPVAAPAAHDEPVFSPEPERNVKQAVKIAEPEESSSSIEDFVQDVMQGGAEDNLDETKRVPDLSAALDDTKIWTDEDEETTPRPKFNFDDLQFGKNVNKD